MTTSARARIITYLILTFALSSVFYWQIVGTGKMKMLPVFGLMWCPGVASLITRLIFQRNLRGIGWGWGATRWQALAYLLPPVMALVVYGLVWVTGIGGVSGEPLTAAVARGAGVKLPLPAVLGMLATVGFLQSMVFALGEELGWRGLLVPELAGVTSFTNVALISGAVWSVYHYPLILFSNYTSGAPRWYALLAFTAMVIASSFVFAWFRLRSGSVWTAVILHASHNLFIQEIFDPMTVDRGITKYITTEFGAGLTVAYCIAAWICWRKRGELEQGQAQEAVPAGVVDRSEAVAYPDL
jgi:membrane protease YdiL (CAAX protease family)